MSIKNAILIVGEFLADFPFLIKGKSNTINIGNDEIEAIKIIYKKVKKI